MDMLGQSLRLVMGPHGTTREAALAVRPDGSYSVMMPGIGAGNDVLVAGFIADWADMDTPTPAPGQLAIQHYGATMGAALVAQAQASFTNIDASLHRARPDLAYQPE